MKIRTRRVFLAVWTSLAVVVMPNVLLADTCWNDCTIAATHWMHQTGASEEEAAVWFQGCLAGCEMA